MPDIGERVKVVVDSIQRSNGAAWRGTEGKVVGKNGDGMLIDFGGDFIADRVKDKEVTKV